MPTVRLGAERTVFVVRRWRWVMTMAAKPNSVVVAISRKAGYGETAKTGSSSSVNLVN